MNHKQNVEDFINKINLISCKDYGDFKRATSLHFNNLVKYFNTSKDQRAIKCLEEMYKLIYTRRMNFSINKLRKQIIYCADKIIT